MQQHVAAAEYRIQSGAVAPTEAHREWRCGVAGRECCTQGCLEPSSRAVERRLRRLSFIVYRTLHDCLVFLRTLVNFALSGLALPLVCARLIRLVSDLNCQQE